MFARVFVFRGAVTSYNLWIPHKHAKSERQTNLNCAKLPKIRKNHGDREGIDVVEITSQESLLEWLKDKDKEICVVLASRISLRVVPCRIGFVGEYLQKQSEPLILSSFNVNTLPWLLGSFPNRGEELKGVVIVYVNNDTFDIANAAAVVALSSAHIDIVYAVCDASTYATAYAAPSSVKEIWQEINLDILAYESGNSPKDIMRLPLWQETVPSEITENWSLLKSDLLSLNDNWQVWTDWYDDRLIGGTTPNGRPVIEELELKRVLISDEDWEKGPSHVNGLIAEMEAEYRPPAPPIEVPDQRPAIIEVEVGEDGKLHRRIPHAPEVRDKAQEESLREAWQAHRHQLDDLLAIQQGHNDPVLQSILSRYVDALGNVYESINIIAVGIHGERLKAQAKRADERYLEHIAGELEAMAIAHDLFVRQFPKWREHLDTAKEPASDETINVAIELPNSLSKTDIITSEVKEPLNDLAQDTLTSDPDFRLTLSNELLHSEENILAALLGWAVKHIKEAGGKRNKISFEKIAAIVTIMQNLPILLTQIWGWVEPVLNFVKRILGLS
jgi:hypothetical protein